MAVLAPPRAGRHPIPPAVRDNPLAAPLGRPSWRALLTAALVLGVVAWSWSGTGITIGALLDGLPGMADFVSRLFPPNWAAAADALGPLVETVQMAIVGTLLAVIVALPLSLVAASNVSPHPLLYQSFRIVLNIGRTIPELVLALAFVAAVGLGAFPGTLALALHSVFSLSKIFAESIEAINPRPVEAVAAAGATRAQTIGFAVLPQALPTMISYVLLYWEGNIRAATVLGLVGAGGIGFEIQVAMRLFQYQDLTTYILMLIATVTVLDRASAWLRAKVT
jgi:phosphonate transport system permease protein